MFHLGEKKRKEEKNPAFLLFEDRSNDIILSIFLPIFRGWEKLCRVFYLSFSSSPRLRVERREKGGRGGPTWFSPSIWLTRPRLTTSFRSDIIRVSRISISASLFTAYSYYMYISAKPGTFGWGERGLRYHVTVCARLLGYCLYIWDLTQVHLRIFRRVVRGVCCNRSDAETESPWVRVPLPFFFAAFCAWLV